MKWTWLLLAAAPSWAEFTPEWMSQPAGCMSTKQHLIIFQFILSTWRPSKFCFTWVELLGLTSVPFSTSCWPKSLSGPGSKTLCSSYINSQPQNSHGCMTATYPVPGPPTPCYSALSDDHTIYQPSLVGRARGSDKWGPTPPSYTCWPTVPTPPLEDMGKKAS